jgi:alcohol dehydrogenase class IV
LIPFWHKLPLATLSPPRSALQGSTSSNLPPSNPTRVKPAIIAGAAHAKAHGIDGIVAVGGGSAIDTAKAIGLLRYHDSDQIAPFFSEVAPRQPACCH